MDNVDELLNIYAAMNPDGRDRLRSLARHMQKRFPLDRRPSLALVKNANYVKPLDGIVDDGVDYSSVVSVGEAVHSK
jgi:hypothetical protein